MIQAIIPECCRETETCPLYMWDQGVELEIVGLDVPDLTEAHFTTGSTGADTAYISLVSGGRVTIPDVVLGEAGRMYDYTLTTYLYMADGEEQRTRYTIRTPVLARPKPTDYEAAAAPDRIEQLKQEIQDIKAGKADGLSLEDGELQLLAGDAPVGEPVVLPAGGGPVESISNAEIDTALERSDNAKIS